MINRKPQPTTPPSSQAGFTIIESLVALIVVSILLVAIAPVIVLSTATRVQARRVERATEAARTFIDAAKTGTVDLPARNIPIAPASTITNSRNLTNNATDYLISNLTQMQLPDANTKNSLYCVAKDGRIYNPANSTNSNNCSAITPDDVGFYIQAARITVVPAPTTDQTNYRLALRVYRGDTNFANVTANLQNPNILATQKSFTGGTGLRNPQSALVEMTTEVNSKTATFNTLCQRLGVVQGACN